MGLKPPYIDGKDRICCGSKADQCDDCPMREWAAEIAIPHVEWSVEHNGWVRDGKRYDTWQDARRG